MEFVLLWVVAPAVIYTVGGVVYWLIT